MTGKQAAGALQASDSMISRIELGSRIPRLPDLSALLDAYGVTEEERETVLRLAAAAARKEWFAECGDILSLPFRDYLALESEATDIYDYQPLVVFGMLQTEAYARCVTPSTHAAAAIEKTVQVRMARQKLLDREKAPHVHSIVDEAVLRRSFGAHSDLRAQLHHLVQVAQRPNIDLRVLPLGLETGTVVPGPFTILRYPQPTGAVVFVENVVGGNFLEGKDEVNAYVVRFDRLWEATLAPEASVEAITRIAEELGAND